MASRKLTTRPYTGTSDGPSKRRRAGTDEWMRQALLRCPVLWANGSWNVRDVRGKPGVLSVHATGRAMDLSYRKLPSHPIGPNRRVALEWLKTVLANWEVLGVECVLDYFPKNHGRGWRCDRASWQKYTKPTISGAPGGDWFHIEITPAMADDPVAVRAAWVACFGPAPTPARPPARPR